MHKVNPRNVYFRISTLQIIDWLLQSSTRIQEAIWAVLQLSLILREYTVLEENSLHVKFMFSNENIDCKIENLKKH